MLDCFFADRSRLDLTITQAEFDNMKLNLVTKALGRAEISKNQIDEVLLVGESALMPSVQAIENFFAHGAVQEPINVGQPDPYLYCKGIMSRTSLRKIEMSSRAELAVGSELDGGIIQRVLKF